MEDPSDACLALDQRLGDPSRDILELDRVPLTLQCSDSPGPKHGWYFLLSVFLWEIRGLAGSPGG